MTRKKNFCRTSEQQVKSDTLLSLNLHQMQIILVIIVKVLQ
jgi:hypothetical protein